MKDNQQQYMNDIVHELQRIFPAEMDGYKTTFKAKAGKKTIIITISICGLTFDMDTNFGVGKSSVKPSPRFIAETVFTLFDEMVTGEKRFVSKYNPLDKR